MLSGVPLIQRLPLGSSLDRQQVITSISGKIQKARTAKRLADLALLAGSPIDAAKYAALASVELKGLDDVQWYVGALSTWCAAAISYIESGSENGSVSLPIGFPYDGTGTQKMGELSVTRYSPDVKRQPGTGRYLLCCVSACAREALRVCLKHGESWTPLASEIALKMSRWLGLAPSYTRKAYLLEFVDVLVGIISDNAGGLGSIEATRVAMAAALICGRAGCVRKAAALVAIAASSHSMFGRNQAFSDTLDTAAMWYLGCSLTSAWDDHEKAYLYQPQLGQKWNVWTVVRLTALKQLASGKGRNCNTESALRAWLCSSCSQRAVQNISHSDCDGLPRSTHCNTGNLLVTQRDAPGHPERYTREGLERFCTITFARFRTPYFARVNDSDVEHQDSEETSKKNVFFNPYAQRRQLKIRTVFLVLAVEPSYNTPKLGAQITQC
jgi:hypothetical protein